MSVNEFLKNAEKRIAKLAEVKETDIEDDYVKFAKSQGCNALKLILLRRKGFPDRTTFCPGGRVVFIEFKRKNKSQSPIQIKIMKMLRRLGFEYHVCDKKGQAENILKEFLAR